LPRKSHIPNLWKSAELWNASCLDSSEGKPVVANRKAANVPVAKDILRYFLRNPEAVDSMTEIARWRLMQEAVRRSVEDTQAALNWLIEEGYMREETRAGTERLFLLNPERRADAESFVEDKRPGT
jgi:hypothetical protein